MPHRACIFRAPPAREYDAAMHWVAPSSKDAGTTTLEKRLWEGADELRANSGITAAQYSQPVLGLIFLRFADAKFSPAERDEVKETTPENWTT
jgi:type I restriction enzyme M protein